MTLTADVQPWLMDVRVWAVQAFFVPGDGLIRLLLTHAPGIARFLELGTQSYGGAFAAIISAVAWLALVTMVGVFYGMIMDLDRALTAGVGAWHREWLRRVRVARRWSGCELRRLWSHLPVRRAARPQQEMNLGELVLTELEVEALRSHALLAPGYVMSGSDLASSLEIRRSQASQLLARLEKLALIERSFSTDEGQSGYRLSSSGRFVLMAHTRSGERR